MTKIKNNFVRKMCELYIYFAKQLKEPLNTFLITIMK